MADETTVRLFGKLDELKDFFRDEVEELKISIAEIKVNQERDQTDRACLIARVEVLEEKVGSLKKSKDRFSGMGWTVVLFLTAGAAWMALFMEIRR